MPTSKFTNTIIQAAIDGFEAQKQSINEQIAQLRAMLNGATPSSKGEAPAKRKRRKFSAAAIKRMREAQQRRWAKVRQKSPGTPPNKPTATTQRSGGLTAAGRKALSIAMKKRWAAKKAA